MSEIIPIGRFPQLLLPLHRNPTHGKLDEQIGPEPESHHRGQDHPADQAPDEPAPVTHLTHLLRNLCKRKTEMVRDRLPKSPNHVRILQIQRPISFLPNPFHDKLVMIQSPRRDGKTGERDGLRLAIGRVRSESDGESMLLDLNKAGRTGGGKLVTDTESNWKELCHGVIDD